MITCRTWPAQLYITTLHLPTVALTTANPPLHHTGLLITRVFWCSRPLTSSDSLFDLSLFLVVFTTPQM